jgi:CRISPR-associated endoribonuclease Cas6
LRVQITLEPARELNLPVHYGNLVQGLIYGQLENNLAKWLHGEAYRYAQRSYRMFTFSRLNGTYRLENGRITFYGPISFKLASCNTDVLCSLAEHLLKAPQVRLGDYDLLVRGIEVLAAPQPDFTRPVRVRTLSPITIYSTLSFADGRKKLHYFGPHEREWSEMLLANLARKAGALEWEEDADAALEGAWIRPYRVGPKDRKPIRYKGGVYETWLGQYELKLPEPYFWLAYDVGVGGKNAQGFGMVEVVR